MLAGDVGLPGDPDRRHGGAAVFVAGLLQPGGARPRRHREPQLLRLRLVQRLRPGGLGGVRCRAPRELRKRLGDTELCPPQADLRSSLGDAGYVVFGVVLFVWELLPTSLVVFFFRVRRPPQERVSPAAGSHD